MPAMQRIAADSITPVPWKNGGGLTRGLAHGERWRISLADIERDGPFSDYPGVQRWFAVVEGGGVELDFGPQRVELRVGDEPLAFDGTRGPGCRLLEGPTRDLNLLLHPGATGTMRRAAPGQDWDEDWPLRAHFDFEARTLAWLPRGAHTALARGVWLGIAP